MRRSCDAPGGKHGHGNLVAAVILRTHTCLACFSCVLTRSVPGSRSAPALPDDVAVPPAWPCARCRWRYSDCREGWPSPSGTKEDPARDWVIPAPPPPAMPVASAAHPPPACTSIAKVKPALIPLSTRPDLLNCCGAVPGRRPGRRSISWPGLSLSLLFFALAPCSSRSPSRVSCRSIALSVHPSLLGLVSHPSAGRTCITEKQTDGPSSRLQQSQCRDDCHCCCCRRGRGIVSRHSSRLVARVPPSMTAPLVADPPGAHAALF